MGQQAVVPDNETCRQAAVSRGTRILESILDNKVSIKFAAPERPVVSVVIVSFNAPELLAGTLVSLSGQLNVNHVPYELVIVDNASETLTRKLLNAIEGARVHLSDQNLGFGGACNLGASMARGQYILFLNPDIEIMPGALDAMVSTAQRTNRVGIVGGRLIFPNGALQEAGANFKDDTQLTHPYLRGVPDPSIPEANYRHQTGYVSGAFLLIDAAIFQELKGFDTVFHPAYFEDTDLCVRCSKLGYSVIYEPAATAVHF